MEPEDAESLLSRVERTFWTVWGVVSEAVNRFRRLQFPNNIGSDPTPPGVSHAETDDSSEEETIVEKCLDLSNSSELLDLASLDEEESEENKPLLSRSNKRYEEVQSTKAEPLHQSKQNCEGMLITRNTNIEEPETPKKNTSQSHIENTVCIKVEGNKCDTYTEETMSPTNAEFFKETDQEQEQLQHIERQNISDNKAGIKLIQGLGNKTDRINLGDSGEEPDGAIVMQNGAENKDEVRQTASGDAKDSEDRRKRVEYAQSENEMIIHLETHTTETTGILPEEHFHCKEVNLDSLVDVWLESTGRQEVNGKLAKTPKGISEGWGVALKERTIPTCKETQEGVPVNNNELSLDENTNQLFLEGDSKEAEAARLPEEVESSNHRDRLQNVDQDCLPPYKAVEEKQDNTEDTGNVEDSLSYPEIQPIQASFQAVIQDPGLLNQEEEKESLESSMKKEVRCYSSDFGVVVALQNKINDTPERQDGIDEAELNKEPLNPANDENGATSGITGNSAEELSERVDKLLKFGEENMTDSDFLEEFVGNDKNQNTFKPESEIALQLQTKEESSSRAPEIKALDMKSGTDEDIDERKTDASEAGMSTKETDKHSISGSQDVIDEEILDLWLEAVTPSKESISKEVSDVGTPKEARPHLLEGVEADTESKVRQAEVDYLDQEENLAQRITAESAETEHGFQKDFDAGKMNTDIILPVNAAPLIPVDMFKLKDPQENESSLLEKPKHAEVEQSRNRPKDWLEERYDEETCVEKLAFQASSQKEQQPERSEDVQQLITPTVINVAEDTDERKRDASEAGMSTKGTDKHVVQSLGSFTGENSHSIGGSQDVIDEEILNLWLEAVTPATESISTEVSEVETPKGAGPHLSEVIEAGSYTESKVRSPGEEYLYQENLIQRRTEEKWAESAETGSGFQEHFDAGRMNTDIILPVNIASLIPVDTLKVKDLQENVCSFLEKPKHMEAQQSINEPKDRQEERYDEEPCTGKLAFQVFSQKEQQPEHSEDFQELIMPTRFEFAEVPTTKCKGQDQVNSYLLDLSLQKFRITVKNPRVRPPTNPRTLLHTPSMTPTPSSQAVPLGAVSIGIKLPGLGASLPVLKKVGKAMGKENGQKTLQKADKETKPEDNIDSPKQEEAQNKPRWTPPKHQGFGNPLMLELKTKLKRTVNE